MLVYTNIHSKAQLKANSKDVSFWANQPGELNSAETLKPLMESKVFKLLHKGNFKKKHFADLQENTEGGGGGGGWMDGWMDGWMRVTLVEE